MVEISEMDVHYHSIIISTIKIAWMGDLFLGDFQLYGLRGTLGTLVLATSLDVTGFLSVGCK